MAPLYAPDSVLTMALFAVPTGLRAKETPTLLGKVCRSALYIILQCGLGLMCLLLLAMTCQL